MKLRSFELQPQKAEIPYSFPKAGFVEVYFPLTEYCRVMDVIPECCFEEIQDNSGEIRPCTKSNVFPKDLCPKHFSPVSDFPKVL